MLIDKGVTTGEVITIKLMSGEEVIGKLVEDNVLFFKISKPMVLTAGHQGIGMTPYLFTVNPEKEIKIFKSAIVTSEATDKQFADSYISGTTGIAVAR